MQILPSFATPRAAIMVVFGAFGTAIGALAGSMPTVTHNAGIDSFMLGLAITASTIGTVSMMSLGGVIAHHASNRGILLVTLPLFALLILAVLTSASPLVFFAAFIVLGIVIGLTDLFMNAEGAAVEIDMGKPIFSAFHASVSTGLPIFAILSSFVSTSIGPWATGLLVMACFAIAWGFVYCLIPARSLAMGRASRIASLPKKMPLVLLGLAAGLMIAAETAAILWSAKLLNGQAPSLAAIAGLGAAFYGLCNAGVRYAGDGLRARLGNLPLMIGSLMVAIAGFAALGLSQQFATSVAAFALVGFGTAVLIPCVFPLAAAFVPANRAAGGISFAFGLYAGVMTVALILIIILRNMQRGVEQ